MDITQVKVFPVDEEKLKAFVSVVFDHCFMVNDIKVIQGRDGLFLSMPSRRKKNGEFKDVAHPLNNRTRRQIEERVLEEYRQAAGDVTPRRPVGQAVETAAPPRPEPSPSEATPPPTLREVPPPAEPADLPSPAPAAPARPAARPAAMVAAAGSSDGKRSDEAPSDRTLEEVQELHLQDSFWSVS